MFDFEKFLADWTETRGPLIPYRRGAAAEYRQQDFTRGFHAYAEEHGLEFVSGKMSFSKYAISLLETPIITYDPHRGLVCCAAKVVGATNEGGKYFERFVTFYKVPDEERGLKKCNSD